MPQAIPALAALAATVSISATGVTLWTVVKTILVNVVLGGFAYTDENDETWELVRASSVSHESP